MSFARTSPPRSSLLLLLGMGTMLAGCDLSPDFKLPSISLPAAFKESPEETAAKLADAAPVAEGNFKKGEPAPAADKGPWWQVFDDETLNGYILAANEANQDVKVSAARLEQARAVADVARADLFPAVDLGANVYRFKQPAASFGFAIPPRTVYSVTGGVSYEPDLFGRIGGNRRAAINDALAQSGLSNNVLLIVQTEVARNYYVLRSIDTERALVDQSLALRTEAERIFRIRMQEGMVSDTEYARAEAELASTRAIAASLAQQRSNFEHALAVLLGKTPAEFSMSATPLAADPPTIPAGLPSRLLERRPDIAVAEAQLAAANARIGIARAAFFPVLNLTATGGFQSTELGDLFNWSNRAWALGPINGTLLSLPIFDGGRNSAELARSKAAYEESVANYRGQILVAFREVEDNLSDQKYLREQVAQQKIAADASVRGSRLSRLRYEEGDYSYLEVVDADRSELAAKRAYAQAQGATYSATIALIRALGGAWDGEATLPMPAQPPAPTGSTPPDPMGADPAKADPAKADAKESAAAKADVSKVGDMESRTDAASPAFVQGENAVGAAVPSPQSEDQRAKPAAKALSTKSLNQRAAEDAARQLQAQPIPKASAAPAPTRSSAASPAALPQVEPARIEGDATTSLVPAIIPDTVQDGNAATAVIPVIETPVSAATPSR